MKRTKIVCTIGPASDAPEILEQLMLNGMNVARLNFSHGSHEEQKARVERIKEIREKLDLPVALLLDTKGPEIRTGTFKDDHAEFKVGQKVVIRHKDVVGNANEFSVTYKTLAQDLKEGSIILIDDGLIELAVEFIEGKDVHCVVKNGGTLSNRKSLNLPGISSNLPALTEKDIEDIKFAIEHDFDFIAASFVRKADDVRKIRSVLEDNDGEFINIIAKIENQEGVDNFNEILDVSDGIMVARGDLGVEIPPQKVPMLQKQMIRSCYRKGKSSITATQMLDSMIRNPRPTRAEVSDVANAIMDGTSAVMLSGETASGDYPVESIKMMNNICETTENAFDYWEAFRQDTQYIAPSVTNAVGHACCMTAMDLKAKAIVAVTMGGRTARLMSRFRPSCPIIAPTVSLRARRQLNICWGVVPVLVKELIDTDDLFKMGTQKALDTGIVQEGDIVVISGGTPVGVSGMTNTMRVQTVGRLLSQGIGINLGKATGEVRIITPENRQQVDLADMRNSVIVVHDTDNSMLPILKVCRAIVAETDNPDCHAVTVGKILELPVVYNCKNATKILKEGTSVVVDSERGLVN